MKKIKNKSSHALVYIDQRGSVLLELGNRDFILEQYLAYTFGVQEFKNKYANNLYKLWTKEMYANSFSKYLDMANFCILGYTTCYKNGKIGCCCQFFGINNKHIC